MDMTRQQIQDDIEGYKAQYSMARKAYLALGDRDTQYARDLAALVTYTSTMMLTAKECLSNLADITISQKNSDESQLKSV